MDKGRVRRLLTLPLTLTLLLALVLPLAFAPAAQAVSYSTEEAAFVTLINNYRVSQGRSPLLVSDMLSEAGDRHSSDMGKYRFFSHTTEASDWFPAGSTPLYRMAASGYTYGTRIGENIAAGSILATGAAVFDGWRNSSDHNENMLRPEFQVIGVSLVYTGGSPYGYYWTTDFGDYIDPTAHSLDRPSITSLSPASGPAQGGNTVVITGTNFTGVTAVTFGGVDATSYLVDSPTQITAIAPDHAAGTVDIVVATTAGDSANTAADDYTSHDATVMALGPGWHLVAGSTGSDTGGNALYSYIDGVYVSATAATMQAGRGYWVRYPTAGTATLTQVAAPVTVHLAVGWNLIGNPTGIVLNVPSGPSAFVYGGGGYTLAATLQPGQGAWIRATTAGDIILAP